MKAVLDSVQTVVKNSRFVQINDQAISDFSQTIGVTELTKTEYNPETILENASEEEQIAYTVIYNTINFCYWGEPKWTVTINGRKYDGSFGMLRALKRAIDNNANLLKAPYLANLPEKELREVLLGNVEIPLFKERLTLLRELGKIVSENFSDSFTVPIEKGNGNAVKVVEILARDFPGIFNDVADYHGHQVKFYKRAQLIPEHLFDLNKLGLISLELCGLDQLTAFADYKVPQILRKFRILEYTQELANKIDNKIPILAGSEEEVEIRASTIWAIELATREIRKKFPEARAAKVDGIFWFRGQEKSPNDKPYHRTLTIWY